MAITREAFKTLLESCRLAIASGDFATAKNCYAQAEAVYQGLALEQSSDGVTQRWRDSLDKLAKAIDVADQAATATSTRKSFFTEGRALL